MMNGWCFGQLRGGGGGGGGGAVDQAAFPTARELFLFDCWLLRSYCWVTAEWLLLPGVAL